MSGRHYSPERERERDHRRDDGWQKEPASTVLIKNVPEDVIERELKMWFTDREISIRDIRLIPKKPGSRGAAFAFVEFHSVQASADWMNKQQGIMQISGDHMSGLVYSRRSSKSGDGRESMVVNSDWSCPNPRCSFVNFAKRSECFRCTTPKFAKKAVNSPQQEPDDGTSQVGINPCNTVIMRGLDGLTVEQSLLDALAAVTSLEPKNCYVMRNFSTGVSLGYAFMEFDTALNGKKIKDHFTTKQSFEVDGKLVMVDYAKNTYSTILASLQYQGIDQDQTQYESQHKSQSQYRQPTEYELQAQAASSANQMSTIQQQQQQYEQHATLTHGAAANGYSHLPQYPEPDVSTYQWDANTGYYYDQSTGLYYDSNTQYYYNMTTQEFMYWDGQAKTYIPVSQEGQTNDGDTNTKPSIVTKEKEEKKVKAKNIAKEMEKWAKTQNKKSKSAAVLSAPAPTDPTHTAAGPVANASNKQASADMAYDVLVNKKFSTPAPPTPAINDRDDFMPPPPPAAMAGMKRPAPVASGLVASYGGDDSDGEDDVINETNHIDRQKLMCNLCERKFKSTAILEKHVEMSGLHKENLAKLRHKSQGQLTKQYRDRAKERRLKEGPSPRSGLFLKPS